MQVLDLNSSELFQSLLEIDYDGHFFDLHNDYDLCKVNFSIERNELSLIFSEVRREKKITIIFEDVKIIDLEIPTGIDLTLDNFYRGRYEFENKLYDEFYEKKCFYIDFDGNGKLNLLANKIFLIWDDNG